MNSRLDYLKKYAPITVNIQGEVSFSHISKMYEGEELIAANKRTQEHGGRPSNKPYCTITLDNPRILNPETLPPDVVMIMQERFKPAKGTNVIKYYATSKSPNLPPVAYSVYAGAELAGRGIADKLHPLEHELDTGLTVTVGARIFDTPVGVGVGIDYVLVDEPVRYYEPNSLAEVLASQGVLYVAPNEDKTQNAPAPQQVTSKAVVDSNAYASGGYAGTYPNDGQFIGEMPYDPGLYYERSAVSVDAAIQNTAPQRSVNNNGVRQNIGNTAVRPSQNVNNNMGGQGSYGASTQSQGNINRNMDGQRDYSVPMQPQENAGRNTAGQNGYDAVAQSQGYAGRSQNTQVNQERPMVRMRTPGQPQQLAG